jgi:SAM-dependent methyltransferase
MLTSEHHSLDLGTAPHAHTGYFIAEDIYFRLGQGISVTIMNHPDIHLNDLMRLLDRIVLEDVWKTTHAELCEWCRITKYEAQWQIGTERAHVRFPAPLPAPLPVEIVHEGTRRQITVPAGEREWSIALPPATAAPSSRQEEKTPRFRRLSAERRAAAFRRRAPARAHQHDCEETEMKAQQPARAALIVRADSDREAALSRLRAHRAGFRYPPADIRVFSLSGGSVTWPVNEQESASLLHHALQGLFDLVVVDQTVRLFDGAFAQTLMACWIGGIRPGGRLYLPLDGRGRVTNGLVRDRAQELLNAELVDHKPGSGCYLDAPAVLEKPASVFNWYATNANRLVLEETLFLNSGGALANDLDDPLIAEFMELGENPATASGARSGTAAEVPDWAREIDNIVSSHAYLVNGLAYKAPVLSWIVEQLLPGRQDLEYVDIGGGFGGLAAELHLMAPGRFAQVLTRELATQNIILARSLYAGLHDRLEGVFRYSPGRAETFAYSRGYDVISFIGSLLYVDKQQLDDVLARVWEGLRPGGLLVVHENIRHPNFTRDYDVMFETETLNAKLGQFGRVRCFLSTALKEVTPAQAESKTVFRVVQKPA